MLLAVRELVRAFGVDKAVIHDWERDGKLPKAGRTLGGHRRWKAETIAEILGANGLPVPESWGVKVAA